MKKNPLRKCIVCGEMKEKENLIRIVKDKDNNVFLDPTYKSNGRGYYFCNSEACKNKIKKGKILNKILKIFISDEFYKNFP